MSIVGRPPHRRGSKKSTDVRVGILNGKPSLQVNWGGRIYGAQLSLVGSGSVQDSLVVSDITASGNITFSKNSSVYNNSNRVLMVGGLVTSGDTNMAIGDFDTLGSMKDGGTQNVGISTDAGSRITTGDSNICIGESAGKSITTGSSNICIGHEAGGTDNASSNTGIGMVIIGHQAGSLASSSGIVTNSVFIGRDSGINFGNGSGSNVGIGYKALQRVEGNYNTVVGALSGGSTDIDGNYNILLGYNNEVSANAATGQVVIGNVLTCTADNTTLIGNTDITLDASDKITLDAAGGGVDILQADLNIPTTKKLYFDGGGNTFIYESTSDTLSFGVGGDNLMILDENGDAGNVVNFKNACAGFTRLEATFSVTGVIGSGGTDDTDIDFRFTNKYRLEMTGDITTINLIFPNASGNFLLVCTTNGDHDVTNWKVYESDESAATTTDVMWAGGSVPAFTNNGIDIVSFYWDANEQQAYGVASLAFATP